MRCRLCEVFAKGKNSLGDQGKDKKDGGANAELCLILRFVAPHTARTKRSSGITPEGRDFAPLVGENDEPLAMYFLNTSKPYKLHYPLFSKSMFIISAK